MVKNLPAKQETQVQLLCWEDPLEKRMATHSSILTWRIPWTEEPDGLHTVHGVAKCRTRLNRPWCMGPFDVVVWFFAVCGPWAAKLWLSQAEVWMGHREIKCKNLEGWRETLENIPLLTEKYIKCTLFPALFGKETESGRKFLSLRPSPKHRPDDKSCHGQVCWSTEATSLKSEDWFPIQTPLLTASWNLSKLLDFSELHKVLVMTK